VKGVLASNLLSNPIRLLSVITDAAAALTTDSGMSVSDLMQVAESFHNLSSKNVRFITAPNQPWTGNPNRVQFEQPQAGQVFSAIAHDKTVPKTLPGRVPVSGGAQVLTTSPSKVKVEVLNGSGVSQVANQAAAGLTSRGFDVTGTGDAASFAYTKSVIEYASSADLAAVNTLKKELSNVTDLRVASLTPLPLVEIPGRPAEPDLGALREEDGQSAAAAGPRYPGGLSEREVEVLRLMATGRSNQEIAATLVISLNTVQRHINHIFTKTGAGTMIAKGKEEREIDGVPMFGVASGAEFFAMAPAASLEELL